MPERCIGRLHQQRGPGRSVFRTETRDESREDRRLKNKREKNRKKSLRNLITRYREDLAHIKARIQDAAQAAESSTTKEERDTAGEDLGRLKALRTRLEKEINDVKQQLEDDYPGFFENNNSSVATSPLGQTRSSAQPQQPLPSPAPQFLAEARNSSRNTQGGGGNVFETTHQVTREDLQHQVTLCKGQVERSTAILRLCRMPADVLMMLEGRLEEDSKQKLEAARKDLRRAKEELTKAQRALDAYDNPGESH